MENEILHTMVLCILIIPNNMFLAYSILLYTLRGAAVRHPHSHTHTHTHQMCAHITRFHLENVNASKSHDSHTHQHSSIWWHCFFDNFIVALVCRICQSSPNLILWLMAHGTHTHTHDTRDTRTKRTHRISFNFRSEWDYVFSVRRKFYYTPNDA